MYLDAGLNIVFAIDSFSNSQFYRNNMEDWVWYWQDEPLCKPRDNAEFPRDIFCDLYWQSS